MRPLTQGGQATRAAASPDGRYVAYVKKDHGDYELRLLQVATDRDVRLVPAGPLLIRSLHFSRTATSSTSCGCGARIPRRAASSGSRPWEALPLPLRPKYPGEQCRRLPDGREIAYIGQTESESVVIALAVDGGSRRIMARRPLGRDFVHLEWSPSSHRLAAVAAGGDDMLLVTIEQPSGTVRDLTASGWGSFGQPAWSADESTVYAPAIPSGSAIWQLWAFDAATGAPRVVTSSATPYSQWSLSATATGDLVAIALSKESVLWIADAAGHAQPVPGTKAEGWDGVVWVDDQIVTSHLVGLVARRLGGAEAVRLRSYSSIYRELTRCGPGRVAYWANDSQRKSHVAATDIETGATTALSDGPREGAPTCSRDGTTLVFVGCDQQNRRCALMRRSTSSGQAAVLHSFDGAEEARRTHRSRPTDLPCSSGGVAKPPTPTSGRRSCRSRAGLSVRSGCRSRPAKSGQTSTTPIISGGLRTDGRCCSCAVTGKASATCGPRPSTAGGRGGSPASVGLDLRVRRLRGRPAADVSRPPCGGRGVDQERPLSRSARPSSHRRRRRRAGRRTPALPSWPRRIHAGPRVLRTPGAGCSR